MILSEDYKTVMDKAIEVLRNLTDTADNPVVVEMVCDTLDETIRTMDPVLMRSWFFDLEGFLSLLAQDSKAGVVGMRCWIELLAGTDRDVVKPDIGSVSFGLAKDRPADAELRIPVAYLTDLLTTRVDPQRASAFYDVFLRMAIHLGHNGYDLVVAESTQREDARNADTWTLVTTNGERDIAFSLIVANLEHQYQVICNLPAKDEIH